jgi:ribose transport system permease protein
MGLIVISRGLDLSEVATMAGAWCVALIANQHGLPPFWTAVLAFVIAIGLGLANGVMVAFVEAPALFVTLATSFVIYGVAYWIAPVYVVYAPQNAPALVFAGRGTFVGIPMPIFVFAAAALVMHAFLSRTSIVISSYLPEILAVSDRILLARLGRIVAEFDAATATEDKIMYAAIH